MVLKTIFLTRHGFRANWFSEPPPLHPTGLLPPDTPLSMHGLDQAQQLSDFLTHQQPPIARIYSSPWYRCIQTVEPLASALDIEIIPEPGLGEWYGMNRSDDPRPASPSELRRFYPHIDLDHETICTPESSGESIEQLYARSVFVLSNLIRDLDNDPAQPESVLLCTHAASLVALSRVLAGSIPEDPATVDFIAYTSCVTRFERHDPVPVQTLRTSNTPGPNLTRDWVLHGSLGGSWTCVVNGYGGFLKSGRQRGWHFSGKESFDHNVQAHGLDAGTGLGVVLEDEEPSHV